MIEEYLLRFIVGGLAVSAFAALGDIFLPKTFAGLFGAAPSIAIATLLITVRKEGYDYAGIEGRSMIIGSIGLCLYGVAVCHLMRRYQLPALLSTTLAVTVWFTCALGLNWLLLG